MFKYTIDAYNFEAGQYVANRVTLVVIADSEDQAIKKAQAIKTRTTYAVTAIEDLRGNQIKKV